MTNKEEEKVLGNYNFSNWKFWDIEVDLKELPTRIYYHYNSPPIQLLEFYIVELHALDDINADQWEIEHSLINVIGSGVFSHKGLNIQLDIDQTSTSKTLLNIFSKLSEMDPHYDK